MRSKLLAVGGLVLVVMLGVAFQWRYDEVSLGGGREQLVRTNRFTGTVERLGSSGQWYAPSTSRNRVRPQLPLPADQAALVSLQTRFVPVNTYGNTGSETPAGKLELAVTNNSAWNVSAVELVVDYNGFQKRFTASDYNPYAAIMDSPIRPGKTEEFSATIEAGATHPLKLAVAEIRGYAAQ